ncbi:unnamed protein product [Kuraishia capsulata CBS 1993]|uniref:DNA replication checkpoint mediator MRC1 domain-containing protein n=1 Tax=Kuraishia capsulata CBS 1993 TaxID=1382522 RepID=W6MW54_9ASCO|nr:uncharacterized protein KUCA_T00002875001 [Kuraishia capsulata CBS 1993]CDK26900.1 unnamed protein product [Kuraishia capsulata CBS 1993]
MDLLDSLEVSRRSDVSRRKNVHIFESDEDGDDGEEYETMTLGPNYGVIDNGDNGDQDLEEESQYADADTDTELQAPGLTPKADNALDSASTREVLERIKRRLGAETAQIESADTQIVPELELEVEETQSVGPGSSQIDDIQTRLDTQFATHAVLEATQQVEQPISREMKIQRLVEMKLAKQKEIDAENQENVISGQAVAKAEEPLFVNDEEFNSEDEDGDQPGGIDTTGFAITSLLKRTAANAARDQKFSVSAFLDDFDQPVSEPPTSSPTKHQPGVETTPVTSPVKSPLKIYQNKKEMVAPVLNYERRMKGDVVVLDSDSDSELDDLIVLKERASKVTRLDVKTRFMKKNGGANLAKDTKDKAGKDFLRDLNDSAVRQLAMLRKDKAGDYINMDELIDQENAVRDLLEEERAASERLKERERSRKARLEDGMEDDPDDSDYSEEEEGQADGSDDNDEDGADVVVDGESVDVAESVITTTKKSAKRIETDDEDDEDISSATHSNRDYIFGAETPRYGNDEVAIVSYGDDDEEDSAAKPGLDLKSWGAFEPSQDTPVVEYLETQSFVRVNSLNNKADLLESQNLFAETQMDASTLPISQIHTQSAADDSDSSEEEEEQEDPEQAAARAEAIKQLKRKQELRRKKRERELKKKGLNTVFEQEAEESEDEWQGLGGMDGELSDQADSEDELLLDDATKFRMDESSVRRLLAKEDIVNDENAVRKLLEDIKTGRLRKRRAAGGALDLELSDDEEEQVLNLYRSRLNKQREALLNNDKLSKLANDSKAKAFFESLLDEESAYKLEDHSEVEDEEDDADADADADAEQKEDDQIGEDSVADSEPMKKKRKITQAFVQKTLSFLDDEIDDDPDSSAVLKQRRELERHQHGFSDDEMDIHKLKQNSIVNPKTSVRQITSIEDEETQMLEFDEDDEDFGMGMLTASRKSSIQSFRSSMSSSKNDVILGTKTVSVSSSYRAASGSKASVTSLGKPSNPKAARSLKVAQIERNLKGLRKETSGLRSILRSGGFN